MLRQTRKTAPGFASYPQLGHMLRSRDGHIGSEIARLFIALQQEH